MKIVIDTETTGVQNYDEILQLSILREDGVVLYDEYFKPEHRKTWPFAEKVHHISPEMVKDKPSIKNQLKVIQTIVNQADGIIGYNFGFDKRFMENSGLIVDNKIYDVMKMFSNYVKEPDPRFYGQYKWFKLSDALKKFNYSWPNDGPHNSLGDCKATLMLFKELEIRDKEKIPYQDIEL